MIVYDGIVGGDGYDDPEELLAHSNEAPNPGEEGHGLDGEVGGEQLHLVVNTHIQTIPVMSGVQSSLGYLVPGRKPFKMFNEMKY